MKKNFTDRLTLDEQGSRKTKDGYLVTSARVARGGNVQTYLGSEFGIADKEFIRVYRPESEVFKTDAIASYAGVPATLGHPPKLVDAATWKEHAVGETGEDVLRDGQFVRIPLMLRDAKAIKALENGTRELSMGYDATVTFADGVTPSGESFDAIMSDFKMNHVALVDKARGGSELRIEDGTMSWGASPVQTAKTTTSTKDGRNSQMTTRTVLVDGLSVETTEAGAVAINKLIGDAAIQRQTFEDAKKAWDADRAKLIADHAAVVAAKDGVIAQKDKDLAAKDAEIDSTKSKIVSDAEIDRRVAARADLIAVASAIAKDAKFDGLSDSDVRKLVVTTVLGDAAVKDKPAAYIDARFDILVEDAKKNGGATAPTNDGIDHFRSVRQDGANAVGDADKVRLAAEKEERDAWKGTKAA